MQAGGLDIFQILLESGPVVKLVLVILVACSVLSWAIIFQKKKELKIIEEENQRFHDLFMSTTSLVEINGQLGNYSQSTLAKMFNQGHLELSKIKEELSATGNEAELRNYLKSDGLDAIERSLKKGANESQIVMDNKLTTLASIGSISPFIGLFGTVWGIINSFSGLASGGGSIEAVAPGIAEALVATAVGLAAAIPAVWGYNNFNATIMKTNFNMENFGQDFLNLIQRTVIKSRD